MKITVNNLKKLVKKLVRPDENSGKEKDTFEAALKRARDEAKYNLTEELREKYADFLDSPIKEKCILYEAFGGRGMTCSPHAIFKYLLTQTEFQEYLHVWVIDDFSDNEPWMGLYRDDPNVKFIKFQSVEYREYLATAKYLINNVSFPGYFTKRKEQIFVDTWHGIPLKTIGFDIPAGKVSAGNTVRNFLAADYLIAPNHFMTEIYENAFKMKNLYPGKILEIGQPRNDSYFHTDREAIFKKLQMAGVEADPKKKLILYAPTWKGSRYSSPDTSLDAYEKMIRTIEENVDTREYQVLVKPHQIVYYHIKDTVGITGQYIPATVDTNELLRATDVLISDYSSIYFDYLVSKKPILFFIPDLAEYKNYRGLYFGIDKLPGPVAETYEQLGDYVKDAERAMEIIPTESFAVTGRGSGGKSLWLDWADAKDAVIYGIVDVTNDEYTEVGTSEESNFTFTNLNPSWEYDVVVVGFDKNGDACAISDSYRFCAACPPVENFKATITGNNTISATWDYAVCHGYYIQWSTDPEFKSDLHGEWINDTFTENYAINTDGSAENYYVRIRCWKYYNDGEIFSDFSAPILPE